MAPAYDTEDIPPEAQDEINAVFRRWNIRTGRQHFAKAGRQGPAAAQQESRCANCGKKGHSKAQCASPEVAVEKLAGVGAAHTALPGIGGPIDSSPLGGFDALLSTVQMPPGIPVATVAVGKAGATNAAVLAAQILAVGDPELRGRLDDYRRGLADKVEQAAAELDS